MGCPGDSFSSDALRLSGVLDLVFVFSPGEGFDGDLLCLTDSALGVDDRNGGISVSLSSCSDFSNSYDENPNEMDFFSSVGLTEVGVCWMVEEGNTRIELVSLCKLTSKK